MSEELITKNDNTLDTSGIDTNVTDIVTQMLTESDVSKTKDLIALFNWNMSKKNVVRVLKLNDLFDDVANQMIKRFATKPDQFSNDDLLNYMKTVQGAITNSNKIIEEIETPAPSIVQNNTQINVNVVDNFDRDSRARILAAIQATLNAAKNPESDIEYEDKTEGETSNE